MGKERSPLELFDWRLRGTLASCCGLHGPRAATAESFAAYCNTHLLRRSARHLHQCEASPMKRLFIQLLILLTLTSCTSKGEHSESSSDVKDIHSHELTAGLQCQSTQSSYDCLRRHERAAAERNGVELTRENGDTCLSSSAAAELCLSDRAGLRHIFLERTQGNFVVVEIEGIEGHTMLLVNEKTGHRTRIDNRPLFSPGAQFFATVSYDTDAGYLQNRVVIRDASTHALLYQVDRFSPGTGPIGIRWTAPERLQVFYSRSEYSAEHDETTDTFNIWRDGNSSWNDDYTR